MTRASIVPVVLRSTRRCSVVGWPLPCLHSCLLQIPLPQQGGLLGAYMGFTLMQILPGSFGFWSSIILAGLFVGFIGLLVEVLVLRPVYKAPELFQLVATFGVILVIQDLTLMTWGAEDLLGPRAPSLIGVIRVFG